MKVAQTLAEKELNDGAEVTRNVFIRQATTVTTNEPQQIEFRKKYDDLVKERDSIESKIKLKEQEIGKMVGFLNTKKKVEKKNELKVLLATLSSINKQIDSLQGQLTLNEDKKIDSYKQTRLLMFTMVRLMADPKSAPKTPEQLWQLPGDDDTTKIDEEEYRELINRYRNGK